VVAINNDIGFLDARAIGLWGELIAGLNDITTPPASSSSE
jgi:hypothetical protein